jgi:CHASE1-domain containing sensor protein
MQTTAMRLTGFVLLVSGWIIVLAAVVLLKSSSPQQVSFVLAGIGVEALGLALVVRSHLIPRGEDG